ncbi:MAG: hypothetical protein U0325_07200 [Polyangiales bacterium]
MRNRLRIPASLVWTVATACGGGQPTAPLDAAMEAAARDVAADLADVTRRCTPFPFDPTPGRLAVQCLPRRGATSPCPRENVCLPEDCPSHCEGCVTALGCVADDTVDAGVACVGGITCRSDGCPPGCRAVG